MKYANEPGNIFLIGTSWKATSLSEFWRRWNPIFGDKNADILKEVYRRTENRFAILLTTLGLFLLCGLWHDMFMYVFRLVEHTNRPFTFPGTCFFCINAIALIVEKKLPFSVQLPNWIKTTLVFGWFFGSFFFSLNILPILLTS